MAKAALLAVLLAITPASGVLKAQPKPPAAQKEEDPLSLLYKSGDKAYEDKKYSAALAIFEELDTKLGDVEPKLKAVLSIRKAACLFSMKEWARAQTELLAFLEKYPKGTEDFFDADNRRGTAELLLIECFSKQSKWDLALGRLEKIRTNALARPEDRVNAFTLSAQIVVERAQNGSEAAKKEAYGQAVSLLKQATAGGIGTPERREAANRLVEIYAKLGLAKEATQLKSEIDAKSNGSPVEVVRSNIQRLEIGDARFAAAESAGDDAARAALYRQALENYQGTLRRASLTRSFTRAIETREDELAAMTKATPKPSPEQAELIAKFQAETEQLKKIQTEFLANKDYDAFISYRIGLCLLELKRPWEAYVAFLDIFENNPGFSRISGAYYYHISALRRIGRNAEAQAKCKEFIQKFPQDESVSAIGLILGDISQEREDYVEAIAHYKWVQTNVKSLSPDIAEEIDFRIASCLFSQVEWAAAEKALEAFLAKYGRSPMRQQVLYMNALCSFFQGKYKETKAEFDKYQLEYPKGQFIPDVRYRQALVRFGLTPPDIDGTIRLCQEWLRDFSSSKDADVINQIPEVHTLVGDANMRLADELDKKVKAAELDVRLNQKTPDKAKFVAIKAKLEAEKEAVTGKAVDGYEAAVKTSRTNPAALEFALGELRKLLPGRGEHKRMRDLFQELFNWDRNDPKAMTYLYEVIRSTERMGDRPEFAQQSEAVRKDFSGRLADARKNVDQLERKNGVTRPEIDAAKEAVKKLSAELEAELAKVEARRQEAIAEEKLRALKILSDAVADSINDRKQEGAEKLIVFLAEKLARKVKRVKPGAKPEPGAYTSADAESELLKLLKLEENRGSLIAQARGFFAVGQLATFTRDPEKASANFAKIAANFKPEELSATILAVVGDNLLAKGDQKKAGEFYAYILEHARSSEYADYGFAGLAEIRLGEKKYKEALALCDEAFENNILMSKELDLRFARARALAETREYAKAKTEFEEIAKTKEWRGEKTAASLYWLGLIAERQATDEKGYNEAIAYYRRCFMTWKKYEVWAARSYLAAAKLFGSKLNQKDAAKAILKEMLEKDRIKDTREAEQAKAYLLGL
jgi:tetratricopeptide (TPR) repeat protein